MQSYPEQQTGTSRDWVEEQTDAGTVALLRENIGLLAGTVDRLTRRLDPVLPPSDTPGPPSTVSDISGPRSSLGHARYDLMYQIDRISSLADRVDV